MFVSTHTGRVRFREIAGGGTPIVFIHGAGAGGAVWLPALRLLARARRRALAPDLPGHGRSDGSLATLTEARDALGLFCAAAGVTRAVLVGHSMGGAIALAATLAWPERVAGLGLVCSSARFAVSPATLDKVAAPGAHDWLARTGFSPEADPALRRAAAAVAFTAAPATRRADFALLDGVDFTPDLPRIAVPTHILGGADDLLLPAARSQELAQGIPGAHLRVVPRCGHFPMVEQPAEFSRWIHDLCVSAP